MFKFSHIKFAIKGPEVSPIDTPSLGSYNFLLNEKAVLVHASNNNFLSDLLLSKCSWNFIFTIYSVQDDLNSFL